MKDLIYFVIFCFFISKVSYAELSYYWNNDIEFKISHNFFKKKEIINFYSLKKVEKNKNNLILFNESHLRKKNFNIQTQSYLLFQNRTDYDRESENEWNLYIKELYGSYSLGSISFSVGRKEILNHFSFIHKPLDLFSYDINNRDDINEAYLIFGKELIDLEYSADYFSAHIAYMYPHSFLKKIGKNHELNKTVSSYFTYINKFSILSSKTDMITLYAYKDKGSEHIFGAGLSQLLSDAFILYSEFKVHLSPALVHEYHSKKNIYEIVLGGQYTFKNNIDFYLEYYFNEWGYSKATWQEIKKNIEESSLKERHYFLPLLYPSDYQLKKHYLSLMIRNLNILNINIHFIPTINLDDLSFRFIMGFKRSLGERAEFNLDTRSYFNNSFSNFGLIPFYFNLNLGIKYFF